MPLKGSRKQHNRNNFVGENAKNKKVMNTLELKLQEQHKAIKSLEDKIRYKEKKQNILKEKLSNLEKADTPAVAVSRATKKRRLEQPTNIDIGRTAKHRRTAETFDVCSAIHGGSTEDKKPTITGMIMTLTTKCKSSILSEQILNGKESLVKAIKTSVVKDNIATYYESQENVLRSINVYYNQDILGKRKYESIRSANKTPNIANFVPYKKLSSSINQLDIGTVTPLHPFFTNGICDENELGDGMFRNLCQYVPRLAKMYLKLNDNRNDKLKNFPLLASQDGSFVFVLAIGGDEAPGSGTSFLLSFLNVGVRVASSFENFLIFGGNVKENGTIVRRYVFHLISEVKELESKVYSFEKSDGTYINVEFKLKALPNDLKMLAFLAGELTNSAFYFSTFGNVHQKDSNDHTKSYSLSTNSSNWHPFSMEKRIADAKKVTEKKEQLKKKKSVNRTQITTFISKELKSRQEYLPLVGKYIDYAKSEPLHLKNNCVKEMFMKVLNKVVLPEANIPTTVKAFSDLQENNLFKIFITYVHHDMSCNKLSKKLTTWFNENKTQKDNKVFNFRFRGKESFQYLQCFPKLTHMLLKEGSG